MKLRLPPDNPEWEIRITHVLLGPTDPIGGTPDVAQNIVISINAAHYPQLRPLPRTNVKSEK